jgi:hypothetical protein
MCFRKLQEKQKIEPQHVEPQKIEPQKLSEDLLDLTFDQVNEIANSIQTLSTNDEKKSQKISTNQVNKML